MAASLRSAATRILRPAVLRRLVHTETKHSEFRASQFKQQKEELYDLIAKAYANSTATWRKVFGLKKGIAYTSFTGAVVTSLIAVFGLAPNPKIVEYEGHLVTAESVPMLQERLHRQVGHQPAATAGGAHKQMD